MKTAPALVLFCAASSATAAPTIDVCVRNEVSVSQETLRHFEKGLKSHEKELAVVFRFTCESESESAVVITLRDVPALNQVQDALGAARVRGGKVLGQFEIFCDPVRRLVQSRRALSPSLEGWALARVAAHEMFHYLRNQPDHKHLSLNEEFLTPEGLIKGFRESFAARRFD